MRAFTIAALAVALSISSCGPSPSGFAAAQQTAPQSGAYQLDARHASIYFRVNHMGFSRTLGRFNTFTATLNLDAQSPNRSSVTATIETASIDSGLPSFDGFLRGPRFLNAAAHPQIRFVSRAVERTGENTAHIVGNLTMNGATHPVTLQATLNGSGRNSIDGRFISGFSATGTLSRAQWGLDAFPAQVGDGVEFFIEAEFALNG